MKTPSQSKSSDIALARLALGLNILAHGLSRIGNIPDFAASTEKMFAATWLPSAAVTVTAYAIPPVELAVGTLLVFGLFLRPALIIGTGVTVNAILPGPTRSAGVEEFVSQVSGGQPFADFEKEFFKTVRPSSLIKRFEAPEEIARLVTFVCSPAASGITGAALRVDGGVVPSCF